MYRTKKFKTPHDRADVLYRVFPRIMDLSLDKGLMPEYYSLPEWYQSILFADMHVANGLQQEPVVLQN